MYIHYYSNGKKRLEGNYKDGSNYKDGKEHGLMTWWYENGQKACEGNFNDGKLMTASGWLPDGSPCPLTNVKDGKGVMVMYHSNGQKMAEGNYKDGKRVKKIK